ncbi:4Fe-4S dicluster domain-containing protein [Cytobacillus gottheilii]|jgi:formate dehydrogenase iron-sulfur subunit|uniref:Electron transfer flavoprotein n=2 Tax=Bacillaceae TaxID=186817 RepID=A0A7V7UVU4_9BACI|nr:MULTISPECIES: 4Fe-4S dicluster domain-containing protein [Bacillaceae]KAB2333475.1 electron transfer flavoprotein [Bacillus mesophilum]QVY59974.1 electron transfer flavoprotein [Cytobacillus gottheilii]
MKKRLYIELENCIGCRSCLAACTQCGGHEERNRNYVYDVNPLVSRQTMPLMCLHCVNPACARSCPAQAIQIHETGAVLSALVEKCIGCQNCTIACPYGIPKFDEEQNLMYKCDLCIDRTKDGIPPMCASVCPSNTLQWLTEEEIEQKQKQYNMSNGKWVTSQPYLEGETNVKVNLPGILQGITKLY